MIQIPTFWDEDTLSCISRANCLESVTPPRSESHGRRLCAGIWGGWHTGVNRSVYVTVSSPAATVKTLLPTFNQSLPLIFSFPELQKCRIYAWNHFALWVVRDKHLSFKMSANGSGRVAHTLPSSKAFGLNRIEHMM